MSGHIEPIKDGFAYLMDDRTAVEVSRQPGLESAGYPFQACLRLIDESELEENGPRAFGLFRLTKTDMRNIKTIINNILKDTEATR